MEEHKKRYLSAYLERTNVGLEYYLNIIKRKEAQLRSCYEELIRFSSDEFVNIVLVDAAFLIELLLRSCFPRIQDEADRIFSIQKGFHSLLMMVRGFQSLSFLMTSSKSMFAPREQKTLWTESLVIE
ncbi:hypothetical protein PanWU01x14_360450 [Parasponia andersonii]|uniref:Uncharacterized protein n=1 Tax=Parasponia andersonii TaxID=3476 RepID=A0A2P5A7M9_PARAD|nr:hypothetical protein PanWU01x14_360450 [Parasponia andersonii]